MEKVCVGVMAGLFWLFVLLPTLPCFLLILAIGRVCGWTDVGFWEFARDWLTFQVIP